MESAPLPMMSFFHAWPQPSCLVPAVLISPYGTPNLNRADERAMRAHWRILGNPSRRINVGATDFRARRLARKIASPCCRDGASAMYNCTSENDELLQCRQSP